MRLMCLSAEHMSLQSQREILKSDEPATGHHKPPDRSYLAMGRSSALAVPHRNWWLKVVAVTNVD